MNGYVMEFDYSKPHEECGVFGVYSMDGALSPAYATYNGLLALQHRGQESCGIAVNDQGVISCYKDMGLVTETFNDKILRELKGQIAVGHVRYSTAGASVRENSQPLVMRYIKGTLAIAHNGNLSNAYELRHELEHRGCIFQTTIDSEVIAYLIARERVEAPGSPRGKEILDSFGAFLPKFKKVLPYDYDRMLRVIASMEERGLDGEQAQIEAFYAQQKSR